MADAILETRNRNTEDRGGRREARAAQGAAAFCYKLLTAAGLCKPCARIVLIEVFLNKSNKFSPLSIWTFFHISEPPKKLRTKILNSYDFS